VCDRSVGVTARVHTGAPPEYHCQVPEGEEVDDFIPKNDKGEYLKCDIYVGDGTENTTRCTDWEYFGGDVGNTVVSQVIILSRVNTSN